MHSVGVHSYDTINNANCRLTMRKHTWLTVDLFSRSLLDSDYVYTQFWQFAIRSRLVCPSLIHDALIICLLIILIYIQPVNDDVNKYRFVYCSIVYDQGINKV